MENVTLQTTDMSLWGLFWQAGIFVKAIMLGLLAASVLTWAIWVAKWRQLSRLNREAETFEEQFWSGSYTLESFARRLPPTPEHPMGAVFQTAYEEWSHAAADEKADPMTEMRLKRLMETTASRELGALEAWLPYLATVGSNAPFVGLLGTVWGVMTSFQSIGAARNTSLAVVAPGIAEALMATAIGLFAAIPAVIAYNHLSGLLNRYAARLEYFTDEFMAFLDRQAHQGRKR